MKKPEWFFVAGLILIGAYFIYKYVTKKNEFNPWELVPKNTIAVYETDRPLETWRTLVDSEQWQALSQIETLAKINDQVRLLDSLAGGSGTLSNVLKDRPSLISMHVTSKQNVGFVYYIPMHRAGKAKAQQIMDQLILNKDISVSRRIYQDLVIQELRGKKINLDFIFYENYMVLSSVGFLMEDIVRNIVGAFESNYISYYAEMFGDPSLHSDEGNLYINGTQWAPFMRTFLENQPTEYINFTKSMFFDASLSANDLLLSGFLYPESQGTVVSTFYGQEPVEMKVLRMIPNNTSAILHIGVSDMQQWYTKWSQLFNKSISRQANALVNPTEIMSFANSEIALATLESIDLEAPKKLLFVKLQDQAGIRNQINRIVEAHAATVEDSVFIEQFADYQIGVIEIAEFPESLLGQHFHGFPASYYMFYQDYLVLASTDVVIKEWLNSMENENTWGKTVQVNQFMEDNLGEANLTQVMNTNRSWNYLLNQLNPEWSAWWRQNGSVIKQFGLIGMQVSNLDNRYYANINLNFQPGKIQTRSGQLKDEMLVHFNTKIQIKPKVVRNHNTGLFELLVQDSLNQLSLLNGRGEVLWKDSIAGPILTEIFQIDYYKNNKLQYLFATAEALHLVDRNGNNLTGYPVQLPEFNIQDLQVIDYDKTKNYRFLIADNKGNIGLLDKEGAMLDGWNPKRFNSGLTNDLSHLRVRGKDRIVIPQHNGVINVLNRRGESTSGFPLDLGFNLESPIFFNSGATFDKSSFTLTSSEGMITSFDLNGKLHGRDQLNKPSSSSRFELVKEHSGRDYILIRHDLSRLAILDKKGNVKFEKDYNTAVKKNVQYYNFGPDKELYVVIDPADNKLYLYSGQGNLLNYPDIKSEFPISVVFKNSTGLCYLYFAHEYSLEIKSFPL